MRRLSGSLLFPLALMASLLLAACASQPRVPYTAAQAANARVLDRSDLRRYADDPASAFREERPIAGARTYLALSGGGALTLTQAELPGLGLKAFDTTIAAGDSLRFDFRLMITPFKTLADLRMRQITRDNHRARERKPCADRMRRKRCEYRLHWLIQIDIHAMRGEFALVDLGQIMRGIRL